MLKSELGIDTDSSVVSYAGSLGTQYMINEMLQCFANILKRKSNAIFLIVTHSDTSQVKEITNALDILDQVKLTATIYSEIPAFLVFADVALYFICEGKSGKAVSPAKQAEFLSLGIPIITNSGIGDSSEDLEQNKAGIVNNDFNE